MQHNQTISNERRRITDTYTLENNYRIKISTYHDRIKKVYWSTISECIVHDSGTPGIYFERHRMHADLNKLLITAPGIRYNSKDLHAAHNTALGLGVDLRDQFLTANADIPAAELISL
jgi:hypothetical protein